MLCGCCQGIATETPEPITNRPGLSAISYRVGTHTTFLASLLAALSGSDQPALAPLRTRDPSDFSIALLDAWATSLDILSFYQERIANESYLRTAVDSASVFALAQLVGYKPSPGVAASAFLAFTLNSAPGSPDNVLIPAGTRVQSVPNPGQQPQVFETSSDLTALIELNAIPAQTTIPWGLSPGDTSIWLQGTSNNLNPGDALLFVNQAFHEQVASGGPGTGAQADFHFVSSVQINAQTQQTLVVWDKPLLWPTSNDATAYIYVLRKRAALFGAQAIDPRSLAVVRGSGLTKVTGWPGTGTGAATTDWEWNYTTPTPNPVSSTPPAINLDASYPGLAPSSDPSAEPQWVAVVDSSSGSAVFNVKSAAETSPNAFLITSKTTQLTLVNGLMTPSSTSPASATAPSTYLPGVVGDTRQTTVCVQSNRLTPVDPPYIAWSYDGTYTRQLGLLKPVEGSSLEVVSSQQFSNGQPVAVFGQRLRLQVSTANQPLDAQASFTPQGSTASVPLSNGQIFLIDAFPPSAVTNSKDQSWSVLTTDGVAGDLIINAGNMILAPADQNDPVVGESVVLSQPLPGNLLQGTVGLSNGSSTVTGTGTSFTSALKVGQWLLFGSDPTLTAYQVSTITSDTSLTLSSSFSGATTTSTTATVVDVTSITTLAFVQPLARIYDRSTVKVNANTVAATQGETMNEILGSGDATNPALQFTLKQSPLTYVSSPLNQGAVSTLQVWVNNMQWHEVGNFLDSGPTDRVFITETDSNQNVTVQFGDGVEGERTPTGQMNIRAVYRKGIGSAGNVQSGQLSQALDRPQGLKGVTNPDPGTGGADPDTASDARVSAPLQVLTLGRVVSLEDYQNYALAFAGIAKALATWTWVGRRRSVFLTLAGANGIAFQPDDLTITSLLQALQDAGNPYVPVYVANPSYNPVLFEVGANVKIDTTDYDPTQVLAQVWQSLSTSFSFDQRQLGQGVAQSEIIAVIQQTPGVIAVELTAFNRRGQPPAPGAALQPVLPAASPAAGQQGTPAGAELLLIDPASQGNFEVWS
jgi:hypothetical protein